ncbi:MAG: hypothetical protein AAFU78_14515 [Cyanobacteria bacterium J06633_2]
MSSEYSEPLVAIATHSSGIPSAINNQVLVNPWVIVREKQDSNLSSLASSTFRRTATTFKTSSLL